MLPAAFPRSLKGIILLSSALVMGLGVLKSRLLVTAVRFLPRTLKVGGRKRRLFADGSNVEWAIGGPGGLGGGLNGLRMLRPFVRTFKNLLLSQSLTVAFVSYAAGKFFLCNGFYKHLLHLFGDLVHIGDL